MEDSTQWIVLIYPFSAVWLLSIIVHPEINLSQVLVCVLQSNVLCSGKVMHMYMEL